MEISLLPQDLFVEKLCLFAKIISVTSTRFKNKPHPESLTSCLRFCRKKTHETVYIGNSSDDSIYAKAAGVDFIYCKRREHQFSGPAIATVHSLLDLI